MNLKPKQRWFNFSNFVTTVLILVVLSMFFFPDVKATMIKSLMKIGLYQPDTTSLPQVTSPVENVIFSDSNGKSINISNLKGKVIFINFWATWCPPCRAEMPSINQLHTRFKNNKNVVFIMVDADGKPEISGTFMKRKGYDLPVYTMASNVPDSMFTGSLPTTIILDKSGRIVYKGIGAADYSSSKVIVFIDGLLASEQK